MKTVLQIGEGNFLRAFAQYFIQLANNNGIQSRVVICQPRTNTAVINSLKKQHGKYNILIRENAIQRSLTKFSLLIALASALTLARNLISLSISLKTIPLM